ncbi:15201_t:CDS:2, partial [Dentiscutata erythropus]
ASEIVTPDEFEFYFNHLWKSQLLDPNDKISTRSLNNIFLYNLLAGVLVRECTKNYSLELSNIPLEYLKLIISNIIRQNNVDWNTKTCFKFKLWFSQNNKITKQIQKTKFQNLLKKKWNIFLKDSPFKVEDGFFKIEDNLTVPELDLKNLAKTKYGSTRQNNNIKPVFKSAQAFQTREYTNNNNKNDQRRDS